MRKLINWPLIKNLNFCSSKGTVTKMKRQATDWDTIVAKDTPYKGLASRIYK